MPISHAASGHASQTKRYHLITQAAQDPADWTHKGKLARFPSHALRETHGRQELRQFLTQEFECALARGSLLKTQVLSFFGMDAIQCVHRQSVLVGKSSRGRGWIASSIKSCRARWTCHEFRAIRLTLFKSGCNQNKSAGCCVSLYGLVPQRVIQQLFREILTKLRKGTVKVPGRDLFTSDFYHEL